MRDDIRMGMFGLMEAKREDARPRALGSLSATVGMPAKFENRTVTGVKSRWIWGALVSAAASEDA